MRRALLLLSIAALVGCDRTDDDRPVEVSVIGPAPRLDDRARLPLTLPAALLADATAQGLVAFDAAGGIEPALADRWIVSDEGRSFIFRLGETAWPDGAAVVAADLAKRLRAAIGPASRNPLKPITGAIEQVQAVIPQVIDVALSSPRPNLLQLLAQPEFAMLRNGQGSGPFAAERKAGVILLRPRRTDDAADQAEPNPDAGLVRMRGESVARAVARFSLGHSDGVTGGSFVDLPIAQAAAPTRQVLRFDPAAGLFGLAVDAAMGGFVGEAANRRALAMAVDRDALVAAFGAPGWRPQTRLVDEVDDLAQRAEPDWAALPLAARRGEAAAIVARWRETHDAPIVRVALPDGPGSRLLLARLNADWRPIGVTAVAAPMRGPADLYLLDAVAPGEIASWYLRRFACEMRVPCTPEADAALIAAREAPTLAERERHLGEADRRITETAPFIALARPLRWSLVGRRLTGWRDNPRAFHSLRHLRAPTR